MTVTGECKFLDHPEICRNSFLSGLLSASKRIPKVETRLWVQTDDAGSESIRLNHVEASAWTAHEVRRRTWLSSIQARFSTSTQPVFPLRRGGCQRFNRIWPQCCPRHLPDWPPRALLPGMIQNCGTPIEPLPANQRHSLCHESQRAACV